MTPNAKDLPRLGGSEEKEKLAEVLRQSLRQSIEFDYTGKQEGTIRKILAALITDPVGLQTDDLSEVTGRKVADVNKMCRRLVRDGKFFGHLTGWEIVFEGRSVTAKGTKTEFMPRTRKGISRKPRLPIIEAVTEEMLQKLSEKVGIQLTREVPKDAWPIICSNPYTRPEDPNEALYLRLMLQAAVQAVGINSAVTLPEADIENNRASHIVNPIRESAPQQGFVLEAIEPGSDRKSIFFVHPSVRSEVEFTIPFTPQEAIRRLNAAGFEETKQAILLEIISTQEKAKSGGVSTNKVIETLKIDEDTLEALVEEINQKKEVHGLRIDTLENNPQLKILAVSLLGKMPDTFAQQAEEAFARWVTMDQEMHQTEANQEAKRIALERKREAGLITKRSLGQEIEKAQAKLANLQSRIKRAEAKTQGLPDEPDPASKKKLADLEQTLIESQDRIQRLQQELERQAAQIRELETEKTQLQSQLASAQASKPERTFSIDEIAILETNATLQKLLRRAEEIAAAIRSKNAELTALNRRLGSARARTKKAEGTSSSNTGNDTVFKEEAGRLTDEIEREGIQYGIITGVRYQHPRFNTPLYLVRVGSYAYQECIQRFKVPVGDEVGFYAYLEDDNSWQILKLNPKKVKAKFLS